MSEKQGSRLARLSVHTKVGLAVAMVFLVVLAASLLFAGQRERARILELVEHQTLDIADSYFDGLNAMMFSGTMANRDILRQRLLQRPEVLEIRVIRGPELSAQYGAGEPGQQPADALDRQALGGERQIVTERRPEGRVLTLVNPIVASENMRGTNCLMCHAVPAGTVSGAVRVSYSLAALDAQVARDQWISAAMQVVLLGLGLAMLSVLLRRLIARPVRRLREAIGAVERDSDLVRRIEVSSADELGTMSAAFNRMLERLAASLGQVGGSVARLVGVAERVSVVTAQTREGVQRQQQEIEQVATAMNEMAATVQEVARNAGSASEATQHAAEAARSGALVATEAIGGIEALVSKIDEAASVIHRLEADSGGIGKVLEVIRGVAEQTNLLALNAAIEAARAGEHGRGFAVVADEVRTLASRTQQSTQEIHQMIATLQSGADAAVRVMDAARALGQEGSDHVEKTAEALAEIAGSIATVNDMNAQIASAAEQQSAVAEEVNRSIVAISHVAEQTAAGAVDTAAASEELAGLTNDLQVSIGRFRV